MGSVRGVHAWLQGADWFESVLVDYDVCSNWGNWVAAAGLTGGRVNHFNITKQSKVAGAPPHVSFQSASRLRFQPVAHHSARGMASWAQGLSGSARDPPSLHCMEAVLKGVWVQDYDEKGEYIKTWVPELAQIPAPCVFEPWRLSRDDQQKYGIQIGVRGLSCWSRIRSADLLCSHDVLMAWDFCCPLT